MIARIFNSLRSGGESSEHLMWLAMAGVLFFWAAFFWILRLLS